MIQEDTSKKVRRSRRRLLRIRKYFGYQEQKSDKYEDFLKSKKFPFKFPTLNTPLPHLILLLAITRSFLILRKLSLLLYFFACVFSACVTNAWASNKMYFLVF